MAAVNAVLSLAVLWLAGGGGADASKVQRIPSRECVPIRTNESIYDFVAEDLWKTRNISLSDYKGKIVVIANVATYWTFTKHYLGLNALQTTYGNDIAVLGFPCNQFGYQEPGANATEIWNGVTMVRPGNGFVPNFQLFSKIDTNGHNEHPLFTFLKKYCPPTRDGYADTKDLFYEPLKNWDIRWNFEKFLINREGKPIMRYDGSGEPSLIGDHIQRKILRNEF